MHRPMLLSATPTMTLSLILRSDAVTMLPEGLVREHLRAGQLVRVRSALPDCSMEFATLTRTGVPLCHARVEFRELLRANGAIRSLPAGVSSAI